MDQLVREGEQLRELMEQTRAQKEALDAREKELAGAPA